MNEISSLSPQPVWKFFELICSIPHISGHEAALAKKIAGMAVDAGLSARIDKAGNVIIERPASPGFENAQTVILQAHLDMVPASEAEFDFINTPITPYIDGEWVRARGTTLGADDGIGMAHALAVAFDKDFHCGKLKIILTTDEEVGMTGASQLAPEDLAGKYLINLDSGENGFCIGCAGGARQDFTFADFEECSQFFKGLINLFRQMNYSQWQSPEFHDYKAKIEKFVSEKIQ
jgi:dipeptidase D